MPNPPAPPAPSLLTRLGRLCAALVVLWLFMHVVSPMLVENIPPLRDYARVVRETDIIPGVLYYTDVPQSTDAEFNNRDAIRYFVEGKK